MKDGPALILDHYLSKWSERSSVAIPGDCR